MPPGSREDRITLYGIKLKPRIGVTAEERRFSQHCEADLTVWGDFEAAATTDSFPLAVDYTGLLDRILLVAHAREYNLLEALAHQIAREVLYSFPVRKISVRLRKRPVSLIDKVDCVEVELMES